MDFGIAMTGLTTSIINASLAERLKGYKNGTTPFEKDAVLLDLESAIDTAVLLNETLLKAVK